MMYSPRPKKALPTQEEVKMPENLEDTRIIRSRKMRKTKGPAHSGSSSSRPTCGEDKQHRSHESKSKHMKSEKILIEWTEEIIEEFQEPPRHITRDNHWEQHSAAVGGGTLINKLKAMS